MKRFNGFPAQGNFTPLPNVFFSSLLPEIDDITELKVTLLVFEILYPKKGFPKYAAFEELLNDIRVRQGLGESSEARLREALEKAVSRGTFLSLPMNGDKPHDIYLLNDDKNRQVVEKVRSGEFKLSGMEVKIVPEVQTVKSPGVFELYEKNIGMLTPLIADELKDAEKTYPEDWIKDAIKEAVALNKRNWRYISRVLERWSTEGRKDGTYQRSTKENTDPDKYIKGKYGHVVQR